MAAGEMVAALLAAAAGTLFASILSLVPALHIYNIAGLIMLARASSSQLEQAVPPEMLAFFFLGMVTD